MELYHFVAEQGKILFIMLWLGLLYGMFYDVIRVCRRLMQIPQTVSLGLDACYWVVLTLSTWYVQNKATDGSLRFCQLLTVALAMFLYYSLCSKTIIWLLYTPLHFIAKLYGRCCRYMIKGSRQLWENRKKKKRKKDSL